MLRAENAHLKRLIEQNDVQGQAADDPARAAELAHLRRERDELQRQLANLQNDYEALQRDYANLQRDRRIEVNEHHSEARTVEAQIEFMSQQHKQELQEKESRIRELEMKLVDLEQEVELAQSPTNFIQVRSLDLDEMKERVADLEKRLQVAKADNRRRAEEADRLREELEEAKARGGDEGIVASVNAERDYFKAQVDEQEAKARIYQEKAAELEEQSHSLSDELQRKQDVSTGGRLDASDGAPGGGEALPQEVKELQQLLKEKEKAVWDLSDRLLVTSTEKDTMELENRQLKAQLEAAQASSQPHTPSGKKSKSKGGSVSDEAYRQVQTQLAELQSQLAASNAEKEASERRRKIQTVEMEQKLDGAERNRRRLEEDKDRLECALKKKDAELAAMAISQDYRAHALAVARGVSLPPLPGKLAAVEGAKADGRPAEDDLQTELALKTAALRSLSVKNAHLNDVLQRLRHATSTEYTEKELAKTKETLHESHLQLCRVKDDLQKAQATKTQLETRLSLLETELDVSQKDCRVAREALAEAQTRNARTAELYKAQNEKYSSMLALAMADVERMQKELTKERSTRREASKAFREQIRRLRASKARRLDFAADDPLQSLPLPSDPPSCVSAENASDARQTLSSCASPQETQAPRDKPATTAVQTDRDAFAGQRGSAFSGKALAPRETSTETRGTGCLVSATTERTGGPNGGSPLVGESTFLANPSGVSTVWRRETRPLPRPLGDEEIPFLASPPLSACQRSPVCCGEDGIPWQGFAPPSSLSPGVLASELGGAWASEVYAHRVPHADAGAAAYLSDEEVYYILGEDGAVHCVPRVYEPKQGFDGKELREEQTLQVTKEDQQRAKEILRSFIEEDERRMHDAENVRNSARRSERHDEERRLREGHRSRVGKPSSPTNGTESRDGSSSCPYPRTYSRPGQRHSPSCKSPRRQPAHALGAIYLSPAVDWSNRESSAGDAGVGLYSETRCSSRPATYRTEARQAESRPVQAFGHEPTQQTLFVLSPETSRLVSTASDAGQALDRFSSAKREPPNSDCQAEEPSEVPGLCSFEELFPSGPFAMNRNLSPAAEPRLTPRSQAGVVSEKGFVLRDSPLASAPSPGDPGEARGDPEGGEQGLGRGSGKETECRREDGKEGHSPRSAVPSERSSASAETCEAAKESRTAHESQGEGQATRAGEESEARDGEERGKGNSKNAEGTQLKPLPSRAHARDGSLACMEGGMALLPEEKKESTMDVAHFVDRLQSVSEKGRHLFGKAKSEQRDQMGDEGPKQDGEATEEIASLDEVDLS
nr:TPA: hypothetical protein BN1204_056770 [Neospora caninum Liverpool]